MGVDPRESYLIKGAVALAPEIETPAMVELRYCSELLPQPPLESLHTGRAVAVGILRHQLVVNLVADDMGIVPVVISHRLGDVFAQSAIARAIHAVVASSSELAPPSIGMELVDVRVLVHDPLRGRGRRSAQQGTNAMLSKRFHRMVEPREVKSALLLFHPDPGKLGHSYQSHPRLLHQLRIFQDTFRRNVFGIVGCSKLKIHGYALNATSPGKSRDQEPPQETFPSVSNQGERSEGESYPVFRMEELACLS